MFRHPTRAKHCRHCGVNAQLTQLVLAQIHPDIDQSTHRKVVHDTINHFCHPALDPFPLAIGSPGR